jgi:hypothetical protein
MGCHPVTYGEYALKGINTPKGINAHFQFDTALADSSTSLI